jgi:hypothetical protein
MQPRFLWVHCSRGFGGRVPSIALFPREQDAGLQLHGRHLIRGVMLFAMDVLNVFKLGNESGPYFVACGVFVAAIFITYAGYFRPAWFIKKVSKLIPTEQV